MTTRSPDEADEESVQLLRDALGPLADLPTTPRSTSVDDLEEGIGALETILLDKSTTCRSPAATAPASAARRRPFIHLFVATVEALMQPRIAKGTSTTSPT